MAIILVVDDDVTSRAILARLLESDYEVVFATNGQDALEQVRSAPPDVILLDVMMPDMDGYEVCRRLKADPATVDIPVIFITALDNSEAEFRGLELGALDFIIKPFNAAIVRARVRNHVELKFARDALLSMATTDGLTGLVNRRQFDKTLAQECKRLGRTFSPLGLIMMDVDHFKSFNDKYGHLAGDDCLRKTATALLEATHRGPDLAARYGGEEFAYILPYTILSGALAVAERIKAACGALAIPHDASTVAPTVTLSFGVTSVICGPSTLPEDIVRLADACLYRAKHEGRNRIVASEEANDASHFG